LPTDDPDYRAIVEEFIERLEERLEAMKRAASEGDMEQIRELAHWLKGTGGTAGFQVFSDAATSLGDAARAGHRAVAGGFVAQIARLAARIELPAGRPV